MTERPSAGNADAPLTKANLSGGFNGFTKRSACRFVRESQYVEQRSIAGDAVT
jgi:hypothetical protein